MEKKKNKRRRTRKENMNLIKSTTLDMIGEMSYADISTNKIAERSGVNIGLLYRYFPKGKVSILKEIINDFIEKVEYKLPEIIINDPLEFLNKFIMQLIKKHRERPELLKAMTISYLSNKESFSKNELALITSDEESINVFKNIIIKLGYINEEDIEEKAKVMLHIIDSIIHRQVLLTGVTDTDKQLANHLTEIILKYLNLI